MKKRLNFRKRLCCSVVAILSLFATGSNSLYAANSSGSGGIPMDVNDSPRSAQEPKVGDKAPDFTFTKDGKSVKLSDLPSGVVLIFSASTSANSDIAKLKEQYKNEDLTFINISIDENADIAKQYGITSTPAICIINPSKIIVDIEKDNVDITKKMKGIFGE